MYLYNVFLNFLCVSFSRCLLYALYHNFRAWEGTLSERTINPGGATLLAITLGRKGLGFVKIFN